MASRSTARRATGHCPDDGLPQSMVDGYWSVILVGVPDYRVVPNPLGAVDTYRIHRTIAATRTTARKFLAVFSYRVATRRNCLSFEKQHSTRERMA